jgi:hypothetical protein
MTVGGEHCDVLLAASGKQPRINQPHATVPDTSFPGHLVSIDLAALCITAILANQAADCCRKAAAVVELLDGLGGLMAHLGDSRLSPQQRQAQVADITQARGGRLQDGAAQRVPHTA